MIGASPNMKEISDMRVVRYLVLQPNLSVKFVPAFGLHGARRKRRAPYLKR